MSRAERSQARTPKQKGERQNCVVCEQHSRRLLESKKRKEMPISRTRSRSESSARIKWSARKTSGLSIFYAKTLTPLPSGLASTAHESLDTVNLGFPISRGTRRFSQPRRPFCVVSSLLFLSCLFLMSRNLVLISCPKSFNTFHV